MSVQASCAIRLALATEEMTGQTKADSGRHRACVREANLDSYAAFTRGNRRD
jgi:hypothetical protein